MSDVFQSLRKVTGNPSNADLAEAVNRLVDEVRRVTPRQGINIRLDRTPIGTIINTDEQVVQKPAPEAASGDLRFS